MEEFLAVVTVRFMKEFIGEFKHLEKICNEIYSEQHGVTQYINEMEQKSGYASSKISGWDKDLATLKRVRHIRNNLVHESDESTDYDRSDLEFMKTFYQNIITQQDPLALLSKQEKTATHSRKYNDISNADINIPQKIQNSVNKRSGDARQAVSDNEWNNSIKQNVIWGGVLAVLILILLYVIFFV